MKSFAQYAVKGVLAGKDTVLGQYSDEYRAYELAQQLRRQDYVGVRVVAREVSEWWDTGA